MSPFKRKRLDMAGMARWIRCKPANGKIAGSIPSQGIYLGSGLGPQLGAS